MTTYQVHFGVIATAPDYAAEIHLPGLGYCSALAGCQVFEVNGHTAFIDGSWEEWGPDGYEAEDSLHVIVEFEGVPTPQQVLEARWTLTTLLFRESRLIDYAVVTTRADWADVRAVDTFGSLPEVVRFLVDNTTRGYPLRRAEERL